MKRISIPLSAAAALALLAPAQAQAQQMHTTLLSAQTRAGRSTAQTNGVRQQGPKIVRPVERPLSQEPATGKMPPRALAESSNNGYRNSAYVSSINGVTHAPISLHYGETLDIAGAHLGSLRDGCIIGLFGPNSSTGLMLRIVSWTDTGIRAVIPAGGALQPTDAARLTITAYNPGAANTDIQIENVHFGP